MRVPTSQSVALMTQFTGRAAAVRAAAISPAMAVRTLP